MCFVCVRVVFEVLNVVEVDSPKIRIAHPEKLTLKGGADDEKAYVLIKRRLARGGGLDAAKELSDAQLAVLVRLNKSLQEAIDEAGRTEFPEAAPVIYSELGVVTRARRRSSTSQRISVMTDTIEDEKTRKDVTSKDRAKKTKAGKLESPSLVIIEDPKRRGMATVPSASEAAEALRLRLAAASAGGGGGGVSAGGGAAAAAGGGMSDGGRSSHARGASRDKLLPTEAHHTNIESSATQLSPSLRIRSLQKQLRLQDEVLKASKSESIEKANAEAKRAALTEELATLLRN